MAYQGAPHIVKSITDGIASLVREDLPLPPALGTPAIPGSEPVRIQPEETRPPIRPELTTGEPLPIGEPPTTREMESGLLETGPLPTDPLGQARDIARTTRNIGVGIASEFDLRTPEGQRNVAGMVGSIVG
ncbi:hypothetical protein LCGC14_2347830, partial [marine sediment metagenome]